MSENVVKPYGWRLKAMDFDPTDTRLEPVVIKSRARQSARNDIVESLEDGVADSNDKQTEFKLELEKLINRYSQEKGSGTPDYILAMYLAGCLQNFDRAVALREAWYGRNV